jgi:hypothetical protein
MTYREADGQYANLVQQSAALWKTIETTRFPETYRAMFAFCAKTNCLKSALSDLIDANNPYVFKLVFRCLCEHYLKFTYLWVRFAQEKSDAAATEYFAYCGASETRDYVSAVVAAQAILGNAVAVDVASALTDVFPEAAGMSTRELDIVSQQFSYRSILKFMASDFPGIPPADRPFLASVVPEYAILSSFVHGGPHTDLDTNVGPRALQECRERISLAFQMTARVLMFTARAVSREFPDQSGIAEKAEAILNRFLAAARETTRRSSLGERLDDLDHQG